LEELVSWMSSDDSQRIDHAVYVEYIGVIKSSTQAGLLRERCPSLAQAIFQLQSQRPSMRTLLNLAALQGVSLLDIFLRPKEAASKPLFDRLCDFDGIPFPPVVIGEASNRTERLLARLLLESAVLLPPLHLLCELEGIQTYFFRRFHEMTCTRYVEAFARQQAWRPRATHKAARAFKAAMHLAGSEPGLAADVLAKRLLPVAPMTPDQMLRMCESAILTTAIRREINRS